MPKAKRNVSELDDHNSDGFIDDDEDAPRSKKTKKEKKPDTKATASKTPAEFWSLSTGRNPRRVEVSDFKGTTLINIREFYEKNDEYLPAKKGISLSIDQYKAFVKAIPEINASLKKSGIDVLAEDVESEDEEEEEGEKPTKTKAKAKKPNAKSNIEATSDEEEDD